MMSYFSTRLLHLLCCLICILLLTIGFYLQYTKGLMPCSLCILQRIVFGLLGGLYLLAYLQSYRSFAVQIYGFLIFIFSLGGVFLAIRQINLQFKPHTAADMCMPGFSYIVTHLPFTQALQTLLQGSDDCGVVNWTLLGLSIAHWSLIGFIALGLVGLFTLIRPNGIHQPG